MKKVLVSPNKYIQGANELENLGTYASDFGKKVLLVASDDDYGRTKGAVEKGFSAADAQLELGGFNGECSQKEIDRLRQKSQELNADVIVGLGGGKALDTAKAVAHYENKPVICVPTIASTDAPCSSLAVIYTEDAVFDRYMFFKSNPNIVLADTAVIAKAPTRFLTSGMGDALSTYFEARACARSFANNIPGGKSTKAALAMAKLCYETLLEDGLKAKLSCDANVVTQSLENIVEANILLSGLGFESSGLAAAHAIHNGLTAIEECHHYTHGEKVAFGTLVHLILENAPMAEVNTVLNFCRSIGLPTSLMDLGVKEIKEDEIRKVAELSCAEGETIHNMPFAVTPNDVFAAILAADQLGRQAKNAEAVQKEFSVV